MAYKHLLNFWPLVPAIDIQAIYGSLKSNSLHPDDFDATFNDYQSRQHQSSISSRGSIKEEMNILIVGDGIGSVIKTVARMYRHDTGDLNIYVASRFAESFSRMILLLSLFDEMSETMGNLEKAEVFLEIFGNTFLRASTANFVETKSASILENIVCSNLPLQALIMVSVNLLKSSEIDEISAAMTFLKSSACKFDITKAWESSLRAYFGTRYDSRKSLFDYHFNMRLFHYPIIHLEKYLEWCETGTAFKLRKGRYDHPNKTLFVRSKSIDQKSDLYYGDIATSPYIAYGVECGNEKMFEKANNQYTHTSEDVSKFNIIDFLKEFFSGVSQAKSLNKHKYVTVYLLFYQTFCKMHKFKNYFDAVYITCDMTNYAENGSLEKILKEDGVVIFETVKNVVNSTVEQKKRHLKDIDRLAKENSLKSDKTLKYAEDCFKIFVAGNNISNK